MTFHDNLRDLLEHPAPIWQCWRPGSGLAGGMLFGAAVGLISYLLGVL